MKPAPSQQPLHPSAPALRPGRCRPGRAIALVALLGALGWASAHATLVFGHLGFSPDPPVPGQPFELSLRLEDPSLAPVEDAVVFVELRPMTSAELPMPASSTEAPELPPALVATGLSEVAPALYRAELVLPEAGAYHLLVRDQTYRWEEANASVVLQVGADAVGSLPFILPPTAVAPRSVVTWMLWLIGLPLLAGLVVTVMVLSSGKRKNGQAEAEAA